MYLCIYEYVGIFSVYGVFVFVCRCVYFATLVGILRNLSLWVYKCNRHVDISEQWHTYSCLSQALRGELVCVGPFSIGNILAIGSEFRAFVSAMGRFNKAKAAPAPSASRGGQEVPVKTLQELVAMQPLPLGGVSCLGRIVYQFGFSSGSLAFNYWQFAVCRGFGMDEPGRICIFMCQLVLCEVSRLDLGYLWFDLVFQGRYPATKVVIKGAGEDGPTVLVKFDEICPGGEACS